MNIIGYYKKWNLVEKDGVYLVVDREKREILLRGTEEECSKMFVMLVAGFINERGVTVSVSSFSFSRNLLGLL